MIDSENGAVFRLKEAPKYAQSVQDLLVTGEEVVDSYQSTRDGVVFTDKRIIVVAVQGLTGKKRCYTSIPYARIETYSVETAGTFELDAELEIFVASMGRIRFVFRARSKIVDISRHISAGVL